MNTANWRVFNAERREHDGTARSPGAATCSIRTSGRRMTLIFFATWFGQSLNNFIGATIWLVQKGSNECGEKDRAEG